MCVLKPFIKFCGGARTVTGSMHFISSITSNIILDCGLFYGHRDEFYTVNSNFPFNPQNLNACVLSHAHIDHSGNIPSLVKKGFRSSIYCTPTTRDFCKYMLVDSGFIQEEDVKYVNKINKRRGLPSREPLYTKKDAEKSLKYFRALDLHKKLDISKDMELTFYESGHILGSALPVISVKKQGGYVKIAYAVDLGRENMPFLNSPEIPNDIDYLIMESTYGGKDHGDMEDAKQKLADAINRTLQRGGKVIIPSFALERTQLVVFLITELMKKKIIKKIPIYVDGPLAVNLTNVFKENSQYFDEKTTKAFSNEMGALEYENVTYIKDVEESKKLHKIDKPVIIISASGMCENGRILHHLKNNIENPSNTVIVVGFMAQNTLGRRIVEREETVRIFGRLYELKAEVVKINAFSSHADKNGLLEYCGNFASKVKKVFLVHGESEQTAMLKRAIEEKLNMAVVVPEKNDIFYI